MSKGSFWLISFALLAGCGPEVEPMHRAVAAPLTSNVLGVYTPREFRAKVRGNFPSGFFDVERIIVLREPAIVLTPVLMHRAEDEKGEPLDLTLYQPAHDPHVYALVCKGYGKARRKATFAVRDGSRTIASVDLGSLPESPHLMPPNPPPSRRFVCRRMPNLGEEPWRTDMSSLLTIAPRKPEPADIAYTYETVQGDRARATTLDISRLILAGPYAQQNGFVRLPNVRYQRSVEMVVRRYRRRRLVEVVDLPGCSLEEVFGKPVLHLDRNVSLLTKGGFRVSLRRQYHPPQHIPRRATRTLNLVDLFVIDERPKPKGGVERPVSTADAQLVSPTPKDLNVDWIAVTNHKYSSPTPTHGPYRLGPLTLRIRVTQLLWSLENTEMVRLPIENAVSYVQVGTNRDGG